ncbi:hypothetical protein EBZ38_09560 [bacterium]|nr:hypothetical protein [bacterium]
MATAQELILQEQQKDEQKRKDALDAKKKTDAAKLADLKKFGQAELARKQSEWTKRRDSLVKDIANNGGTANPRNASKVDDLNKVLKDLDGIDSTLTRLKKEGEKAEAESKRPKGVPATAKYNADTKTWSGNGTKWDTNGKIIPQGAPTGTVAEKPVSQTGFATNKSGVLLKDGQTYSGVYEGKTYKDGKVVTTSAGGGAKGGAGAGDKGASATGDGVKDTKGDKKDKLTFEEIFAKAQQTYGDIDEIFKQDDQLKKLLTDAVEKKFTAAEFLNRLKGTDWWQTKAGTVRQRQFEMREYDRQLAKLDKNAPDYEQKLATLNSESAYGRGISDLYERVKATRDARGASFDDAEALKIAKGLYNLAFEGNELRINNKISEYITATGAVKGQAGKDLQALRETARANGFDLEKDPMFSGQLTSWLKQIAAGKPLEDFQQLIRDEAAKKQGSAYVRDLLRSGYNLDGVYGNYISRMASAFNVDPNTIKVDDPILAKVFGDKGGITFGEFDKLIRQDTRFKNTPTAGAAEDLKQSIADRAIALGVGKLTEADLSDITSNALALGLGASSALVDKLIRAKFTYTPGKSVGGAAGAALTQLRATAAANGFDLDKQFGSQLNSWLTGLLEGEDIETYKAKIRATAKIGLPQNVAALLDQGNDLDTIFTPYKNVMANVLEVNPNTITLNDKTLRSAIGPDKEMTIYDFENALRKDNRWQYTQNARKEVSDIISQIRQDFGFLG